jgi:hypothetical protein
MIRIDMVGPPGVGKTTFYNYMSRNRKKPFEWYTVTEGQKKAVLEAMKSTIGLSSKYYLLKLLLQLPTVSDHIVRDARHKKSWNEFEGFINTYKEFFTLVSMKNNGVNANITQKIKYYLSFIDTLKLYSFINTWIKDDCVLWDESITHKIFAVMPWNVTYIDVVEKYCSTMPLPDAVICIADTPVSITKKIIDRQSASGRVTLAHRSKDEEELTRLNYHALMIMEKSIQVLSSLGVPSLIISGQDSDRYNYEKATNFINKINRCFRQRPTVIS